MRFAIALLTIASLGGTLAIARPEDKSKSTKETTTTASTDTGTKKQSKKKSKKHDKAEAAQPETK